MMNKKVVCLIFFVALWSALGVCQSTDQLTSVQRTWLSRANRHEKAGWGSSCGMPFVAKDDLEAHPQFDWMTGLIVDRPTRPWTVFKAGETK